MTQLTKEDLAEKRKARQRRKVGAEMEKRQTIRYACICEFEPRTFHNMKGEAIFDRLTHRNKTTGGELTCFTSSGNPTKERSSSEPSSAEMRSDDTGQTWLDMYSQYPFLESKKVGD